MNPAAPRERAGSSASSIEAVCTDPEPTLPGPDAPDSAENPSAWDTQPMAVLAGVVAAAELETAPRHQLVAVATGDIVAEQDRGGSAPELAAPAAPAGPDAPSAAEPSTGLHAAVTEVPEGEGEVAPPPPAEESPAPAALDALERTYRAAGRTEALVEPLIGWAEGATSAAARMALLERLARLYAELGEHEKAAIVCQTIAAELPAPPVVEDAAPPAPRDAFELLADRLEHARGVAERIELHQQLATLWERDRGDTDRASDWLERALELDPRHGGAQEQLDELYRRAGRHYDRLRLLERRTELSTSAGARAALQLAIAALYEHELDDPVQALAAYQQAHASAPDDPAALQPLLLLAERLGDARSAALALEALIRATTASAARAALWHRLGVVQREQLDDAVRAEACWIEALELEPARQPTLDLVLGLFETRGDWGKALGLLQRAEGACRELRERQGLLRRIGEVAARELGDGATAIAAWSALLDLDADDEQAADALIELLWEQHDHPRLLSVLGLRLRRSAGLAAPRLLELHARAAQASAALDRLDQAATHCQQALALDPRHLPTLALRADVLRRGQQWLAAAEAYEQLTRQGESLPRAQLLAALLQLGDCARQADRPRLAITALGRAVALDEQQWDAWLALAELQGEAGEWEAVVRAKRALLVPAGKEAQAALWREIGDLHWRRLQQTEAAEEAFRQALALRPDDRAALQRLLELCSETDQWREAIDLCRKMAELEQKPELQAKYHHAAAVMARDKLDDAALAIRLFNDTLDADPQQLQAFSAIDELCTRQRDWKQLELNYARMIQRLPAEAAPALRTSLWHNLGEVLRTRRRDFEAAIAAFEAADRLDPGDRARAEMLAELYYLCGPEYRPRAITLLQRLLQADPGRAELLHQLHRLQLEGECYDQAWCLAATLAHSRQATPEELKHFRRYRPRKLARARARLSDEVWQRELHHPLQDPRISAVFAIVAPVVATTTARPHAAFGLKRAQRQHLPDDSQPITEVFGYLTGVLSVAEADLFLQPDQPLALLLAHTSEAPSFVAGALLLDGRSELELSFILARQLAFLRPALFLRNALNAPSQLLAVLLAVRDLFAAGADVPRDLARQVTQLAKALRRHLHPAQLEQLGGLVPQLPWESLDILAWWNACELTADRVGLLLCGDLELAATTLAADPGAGAFSLDERIAQLGEFMVSESCFRLRELLGLTIEAQGA
ncbi:MAG: hypothetical protein IPG96_21585 [Proteobacteria bacterium]|nr:hypothetical protein [Pseudomonadota bacterium]